MELPDLVGGLKAIPGCLGVETAQTASGKFVVFAWFEGKEAVLRWYWSPFHQNLQRTSFPNYTRRQPLEGMPDDVGPIMAVASLTFSERSAFEDTPLPISQISIELYTPLTGGIFLGGRFAPEGVTVERMRNISPGG